MSTLTQKDLRNPFNGESIKKIRGVINRAISEQKVAATLAGDLARHGVAANGGLVRSLWLLSSKPAAAGESLTIDVTANGVSLLAAPFVFDSTKTAAAQIELPLAASHNIVTGDPILVSRTYVAGGGPTMTASSVGVEWAS
jgi:hypothetical protein